MKKPSRKTRRNLLRTHISVVPEGGGWSIRKSGSNRASGVYPTQSEAVRAARDLLQARSGGEITVYGRDGRICGVDTYSLGSKAFGKVSAIEGIALTREMEREFQSLDRQNLPPAERRRRLIAKYSR